MGSAEGRCALWLAYRKGRVASNSSMESPEEAENDFKKESEVAAVIYQKLNMP